MFLFGESVTRQRAATSVDPYTSESRPDWTKTPVSVTITGCAFDPGGSTEAVDIGRAPVTTSPRLFAPVGSDIKSGDRIVARGATFEVDGNPADWRSPFTGWNPGIVVGLQLVEG